MNKERKNTRSTGRKNSLNREDWLDAALESLNDRGIDAVKVLPLSHKLGVTRGSFYWHFKDREDLLRQMLKYWEQELTDQVIISATALDASSEEKLRYVVHNVLFYRQHRYDTAITAWSMFDEVATQAMKRVLRKRMRFVTRLLENSGFEKDDAVLRSRFLVGFLLMDVNVLQKETVKQRNKTIERCIGFLFQQPAGNHAPL